MWLIKTLHIKMYVITMCKLVSWTVVVGVILFEVNRKKCLTISLVLPRQDQLILNVISMYYDTVYDTVYDIISVLELQIEMVVSIKKCHPYIWSAFVLDSIHLFSSTCVVCHIFMICWHSNYVLCSLQHFFAR
jgi:hypothetical protein